MKTRIGISPCPNDVFIFSGLLLGKTPAPFEGDFLFEDVETLNRRARKGEGDLIKISYANALNCPDYDLLQCGGALGRSCGPLLLTGGSAWNPENEVLVPGENTTANFLLDFWAKKPLRKRFLPFDALYRELRGHPHAQGVVIHEMRFTYAGDGLNLVQDLGEHWEKGTGHPIPLGALAYRADSGPSRETVEAAVRASLDWAWAHEEEALALCARHAQSLDAGVLRAHVKLYVNAFTRDLGAEGRAALEAFLAEIRRSTKAQSG
jgi:1,4-dihydroxy-6-naphthoate synthase